MTTPAHVTFAPFDIDSIANRSGRVVIFVAADGKFDQAARKVNSLSKKTLERLIQSEAFEKMAIGDVATLAFPVGMAADAVLVAKLGRRASIDDARRAGAAIAKLMGDADLTLCAAQMQRPEQIAFGIAMRAYSYTDCKSSDAPEIGAVTVMVGDETAATDAYAPLSAIAEGTFFTRDLVNAPANVLTTTTFAEKLLELNELGVEVEVLDEPELEKLGMGSLLCVGQGSDSPSKVVVMKWNGGGDEAPFAFVGKGVVFDTGGISLKPAAGMEDMTMDMGGAGVVSGVMKTLALRKAKANVVGLVGLVENMPSGSATRPGDIVTSMKGTTIEVINTDAEGRLVLADVLWYAQERFKPLGIINLATLTGAIIIALGHENAGVFSNNDTLAANVVGAAAAEGEGAWRMPMGSAYDKLIKSNNADIKNTGGRAAGSITAAQFLRRFVEDDMPWAHIDIAGTADTKTETALAPKGATGWGVMALNRLIADHYEA